MKHFTLEIEIKKGVSVTTKWGVFQDAPYPSLTMHGSSLQWQNAGGLLPSYGNPATGLADDYTAVLLVPDYDPATEKNNRLDYAGYDGNPGTFSIRGVDQGETIINIERPESERPFVKHVSYLNQRTDGEKKFYKEKVVPAIVAFIKENKAALKQDAVDRVKASVAEQVNRVKESLPVVEREILNALKEV